MIVLLLICGSLHSKKKKGVLLLIYGVHPLHFKKSDQKKLSFLLFFFSWLLGSKFDDELVVLRELCQELCPVGRRGICWVEAWRQLSASQQPWLWT